ncbi:leucine-rich repeat-containing protein 49-like isoform X1 [Apostichopus japonicus]|uniref:leucine-rich repeat-containing protein 49-like isoform X1 n=1 Tax=Stichopus japonicus TaxID=307972 RepID=UPI003AB3456B
MNSSKRSKQRTAVSPKEVNLFGLQFSVQPAQSLIHERPSYSKQDERPLGLRDSSASLRSGFDLPPSGRTGNIYPLSGDATSSERLSHSPGQFHDVRSNPKNRQVHHPSQAYATTFSDLSAHETSSQHSHKFKEEPAYPLRGNPRQSHSAGVLQVKQPRSGFVPGDRVVFSESPSIPGVPIVYRSPEEKGANPDRLNLDRRRLTVCPILEGEEQLRLLNFQHNAIQRIEHLNNLRRLIFLDLYDNRIEEISGLSNLKSLRVLMLGKNRIRKIESLTSLGKLDVLDLHGNQITHIENLDHLVELRVLNLAGNEISHVGNLRGMESLTELNLRRNKIITVNDVDSIPKLQRLFLSFNRISCFEDISCLADASNLSEISLDGNPFCQDGNYRQMLIKAMHQLSLLDMKKISDEEKKMISTISRKEEQKKREMNKLVAMKEKRRIAINNAARQWEITKGTAMAKTIHLQPHHLYDDREGSKKDVWDSPDLGDSRPTSGNLSTRSSELDVSESRSRDSSRPSTRAESRKSKAPTPDLLANLTTDSCHLAELEGTALNLYGPGSLDALDKSWGVQAAGSIDQISFKFIDFDKIAGHLHKIRLRFPNVATITIGQSNLCSLQQLNAFAALRRLDNLSIDKDGNPLMQFTLWKPYLLFRLSHLSLKTINNEEVQPADTLLAQRRFKQLAKHPASELPTTRLLSLLGDSQRRQTQSLSEAELKAKKLLITEGEVTDELVGKAGLVYYPENELKIKQRERQSKVNFSMNYISHLATQAIKMEQRQSALEELWPQIFAEMIQEAVSEMWDVDAYRERVAQDFGLEGNWSHHR